MYNKLFKLILGMPKSIWINFKSMPWNMAIKLPVLVSPNTKFKSLKGCIIIEGPVKTGLVKIGFNGAGTSLHLPTVIENNGTIRIKGPVGIGGGMQLSCSQFGEINIGSNVSFTGETHIVARKYIEFGNDCTISWNTQIMDTDSHPIYINDVHSNKDEEIIIGNHVWIGSRVMISKGAVVPDGCVVASGSHINKMMEEKNCVITGLPVRVLKRYVEWRI